MGHTKLSRQPESTPTEETDPRRISPEDAVLLRRQLKDWLIRFNGCSKERYSMPGANVEATFRAFKARIDLLKQQYPDDINIRVLEAMYDDLKGDLDQQRDLHFDSSFDAILKDMQEEISASGVRVETAENTILSDTVSKLRECGIEPDYIVTRGDSNAKTVVLFLQLHPNPGLSRQTMEELGILQSQEAITKAIRAASDRDLIEDVYCEGVPFGQEISQQDAVDLMPSDPSAELSYFGVKRTFGNKVRLNGIEDMNLLAMMAQDVARGREKAAEERGTAHNIFLGDNIAVDLTKRERDLAFLILGSAHEINFGDVFGHNKPHPLPLSHVLAYNGVNVIVVDETKHLSAEKARQFVTEEDDEETLAAMDQFKNLI